MSDLGEKIVEQARSYKGTKWRHLGRGRGGLDCVGLITAVAYDLGICDYTPIPYTRNTRPETMVAQFKLFCYQVNIKDAKPGDIALFYTGHRGHCGFFTGNSLIHSYFDQKKVVESDWKSFINQDNRIMKLSAMFRFRE